jgi:methylated-DNA-[protein]-cysteine S-methyltransferase
VVQTPVGELRLWARSPTEADELRRRVAAYVGGSADGFEDVSTPEGTPFQRACWDACRRIPRGETRTYAWLAAKAGSPDAVRAAGQAMRRNPLPVVVPCHRVVSSGGGIGGYAGDTGPDAANVRVKRFLLDVEGAAPDVPSPARTIDSPRESPNEPEMHRT